jgi:hypothetical protein
MNKAIRMYKNKNTISNNTLAYFFTWQVMGNVFASEIFVAKVFLLEVVKFQIRLIKGLGFYSRDVKVFLSMT